MSEEFARHVLRVVVAQVCASFGFQSIEQFALETLVDSLQSCKYYINNITIFLHDNTRSGIKRKNSNIWNIFIMLV